jgi:hypothetical protein
MFVSGDSSKFFDPLLLLIFYEITRHSFEVCRISNLVLEMVDGAAGGWKPALCVVVSEVFNTGTILLSKVAIDWTNKGSLPQHFRRRFHPAVCPVLREVRMFLLDL